jgi:Ca2+:H+ antiporter
MAGFASEFARKPLHWLLLLAPAAIAAEHAMPDSHGLLFVLSVAAIVPLAAVLSHATESLASRTGDAVGGLMSATLGNLTELVITISALRAGMHDLVRASLAGAVVTNTLLMLGGCFLVGGLRHHVQEYNPANAKVQAAMLLLATVALLIPSALVKIGGASDAGYLGPLSVALCVILLATYAASLVFSLKTHRDLFASAGGDAEHGGAWPLVPSIVVLAVATVLVALVSEVFVGSVEQAAASVGMSKAFVGFVVVSAVAAAAEFAAAFSAAVKDRMDLSVGIALGSSSQIALFVTPVLVLLSYAISPAPMLLTFPGGQVLLVLLTTLTVSAVTGSGRSAWYVGVQLIAVYSVFATTLYLLPEER